MNNTAKIPSLKNGSSLQDSRSSRNTTECARKDVARTYEKMNTTGKDAGKLNIEERIRTYIAENILFTGSAYNYPNEASFVREGIISSTNLLELILFAEKDYGISVDDDDIVPENFDSVASLAAFIRRKI